MIKRTRPVAIHHRLNHDGERATRFGSATQPPNRDDAVNQTYHSEDVLFSIMAKTRNSRELARRRNPKRVPV